MIKASHWHKRALSKQRWSKNAVAKKQRLKLERLNVGAEPSGPAASSERK
jgi:hypothetical protein